MKPKTPVGFGEPQWMVLKNYFFCAYPKFLIEERKPKLKVHKPSARVFGEIQRNIRWSR